MKACRYAKTVRCCRNKHHLQILRHGSLGYYFVFKYLKSYNSFRVFRSDTPDHDGSGQVYIDTAEVTFVDEKLNEKGEIDHEFFDDFFTK